MGQSSSDDKGARASGDLTQAQKGMQGRVERLDFPFCLVSKFGTPLLGFSVALASSDR